MIVGIGVDLCDVARLARAIDGETGAAFRRRVFTEGEQAYCDRRRGAARDQSYAARFAAKEAAMKALGTGWSDGIGWQDVEVVRDGDAAPRLVLHGAAASLAASQGVARWHLTLSHTEQLAIAWAMAEGVDAAADPTAAAPAAPSGAATAPPPRPPTPRR